MHLTRDQPRSSAARDPGLGRQSPVARMEQSEMRDLPLDHTNPDFALAASGLRLISLAPTAATIRKTGSPSATILSAQGSSENECIRRNTPRGYSDLRALRFTKCLYLLGESISGFLLY